MPVYVTPGVYFERVDADLRPPEPLRTDIAGFVGIAERGPLHRPLRLTSWQQFQAHFGECIPGGYLAYAVKGFFDNGGRTCFVVRVAQTQSSQPAYAERMVARVLAASRQAELAAPLGVALPPGCGVAISGAERDTVLTAAAMATDRVVTLESVGAIGLGSRLSFYEPAARRAGVTLRAAAPDATHDVLRIEAAHEGAWGDSLAVIVQHVYGAVTTAASLSADGMSAVLDAPAGFERGSLVRIRQAGSAPLSQRIIAVNRVPRRVVWQAPLTTVDRARPLLLETIEFSLAVLLRGQVQERFERLSMAPEHPRYVIKLVNGIAAQDVVARPGSNLIRTVDLLGQSQLIPQPAAELPVAGMARLAWGYDGLRGLTVDDFLGNTDPLAASEAKGGLSALEGVDEVAIVAIPDIHIQPAPDAPKVPPARRPPVDACRPTCRPTPVAAPPLVLANDSPPRFSDDEIQQVQRALIEHCEARRDRVAILDTPVGAGGRPRTLAELRVWRSGFDSPGGFAALYYPWVRVIDPLDRAGRRLRAIPPSGHIAGLYARTDTLAGVHTAPANAELLWATDLTAALDDAQQGVLNPLGINVIRAFPGRGLRVYGARTVSSDPDWRFINVRRLLAMIEEAVEESMQWVVFEPNTFTLRQGVISSVASFLELLWRDGALAGTTAQDAFFVKCDETNNPPGLAAQGRLICDVGVAPAIPAEFVVFRVGRVGETLEIIEE